MEKEKFLSKKEKVNEKHREKSQKKNLEILTPEEFLRLCCMCDN